MENQFLGILTILCCAIGYLFAWKAQKKERFALAVLLLCLCGFLLRLYTSADFFLHFWDERYHALVAKHLIKSPLLPTLYENPVLPYDYTNWVGNHIWVHKQPLPLWSIAASMKLFGVNEIALRLPSILLTTIGIGLCYSIGKYFFNQKAGFIAAFLYSINGLIIELTAGRVATDHIDIFFLFFVQLAIFLCIKLAQKKQLIYTILIGISLSAAILSKWLPALIVLPVGLFILLDSNRFSLKEILFHAFLLLFITTALVVPWQWYIFEYFPKEAKWEAEFNFKHITEALDKQGGPFYYFFNRIRINYGELIYLPLFWFFAQLIKKPKSFKLIAMGIWFLIPFLFFSAVKTKMQAYILFISPTLFIMSGAFFVFLIQYMKEKEKKWIYQLTLILLIALPIRYSIERIKPFSKKDRNPQWVVNLKELHKEKIENGILFNHPNYIEAMFYTDLTVYPDIPDASTIELLKLKGYTLLIVDNGQLPDEILKTTQLRTITYE